MWRYSISLFLWIALAGLPSSAAGEPEGPIVDERADRVLRRMSDHLGALTRFSFHAENTTDEILSSGRKLQFGSTVDVALRRPDRFRALVDGYAEKKKFFYDGQSLSLLDTDTNYYATLKAPPNIDAALAFALEAFALEAPLSELLYSAPYPVLTAEVESGIYVGQNRVHGIECHHLAFTQRDIDWQIWVEKGEKPWPRKLVITAKRVAGSPQFTALLFDWRTDVDLPESTFTFVAPEGSERIDFLPEDRGERR